MTTTKTRDALQQEALAFDKQIEERIAAGYIPDLRQAKECAYFYNNPWRHPDYIALDFGEQLELIRTALRKYKHPSASAAKLLEVGCGPGHMSLELARQGYHVTGIDLSKKCIETAQETAEQDPWLSKRGPINYIVGDFLDTKYWQPKSFDAVVFIGALHHFPDQVAVAKQITNILIDDGIVLIHEPTRDRMTKGNAAFIHLVRLLLSQSNGFYQDITIPDNRTEYRNQVDKLFYEMRYEEPTGEKKQSVLDNEAGFMEMMNALQPYFRQIHFQERYAFFHELIGGLRFSEEKNKRLAWYFRHADAELCRLGVLQPTEFFYVGQKRGLESCKK